MNFVLKLIGSFAFTGFFPIFPATFACAVFIALWWLIPGGEVLAHPIVFVITMVVSVPVATWMEKRYGKDPGCVVIDEVVGMQTILAGAGGVGGWGLVAAFLVFRVFDVLKPFPAGRSQRLRQGYGIVADDVLAGLYSRVAMIVLSLVFPSLGDFIPW